MPAATVVLPASREDSNEKVIADRYRIRRRLGSGAMGIVFELLKTWTNFFRLA